MCRLRFRLIQGIITSLILSPSCFAPCTIWKSCLIPAASQLFTRPRVASSRDMARLPSACTGHQVSFSPITIWIAISSHPLASFSMSIANSPASMPSTSSPRPPPSPLSPPLTTGLGAPTIPPGHASLTKNVALPGAPILTAPST